MDAEFSADIDFPFLPDTATPEGETGKLLLSPTSIISYITDPAKYYFRKILRMPEATSHQALEGSTYHKGIEFALNYKKQYYHLPPASAVADYIDAFLEERTKELAPDARSAALTFRERALAFITSEIYAYLETITPKFIEHYIRVPYPERDYDLHGYIDLVDSSAVTACDGFDPRTDTLIDFKSRALSPPKDAVGDYVMTNFDRLQLTLYAYMLTGGLAPVSGKIVYLIKTKIPKVLVVSETITSEMQLARMKTVDGVARAISAEVFTPAYGSWSCSQARCTFWDLCTTTF